MLLYNYSIFANSSCGKRDSLANICGKLIVLSSFLVKVSYMSILLFYVDIANRL